MSTKIALVSGASRGIGAAIADKLASAGMTVIGTATTQGGAEAITSRIKSAGHLGSGMVLNVGDAAQIDTVIKQIASEYGAIDVLVNNAAVTRDNLLMRMKEDEWQEVLDTNLTSVYRLSKACMRGMMKSRWGRIISVSSVVGSMGNPGQANYSASKAGLEGFTRSLASELGSRAITVNAVAPGFIQTDMTADLPDDQKELLQQKIPLARLGQPEEIAAVVNFLASDEGAYITGETIQVNGGMYMA